MNKICRVISTVLIMMGLYFLCFYIYKENVQNKFFVLRRPSYFMLQNYWYIFLAGIVVLVFSLLGSFFSWFKGMEEKEGILPNAGYSSKKDITNWVGGSSLDTEQITEKDAAEDDSVKKNFAGAFVPEKLVLLMGTERTEKLEEDDRTELLIDEDRTELLTEDITELICEKTQGDSK